MSSRNLSSDSNKSRENIDSSQEHVNPETNSRDLPTADRILLTSRRQKVRTDDTISKKTDVFQYIDTFEESIKDGFDVLRQRIFNLEEDKSKLEKLVTSLENSLQRTNEERDQLYGQRKKIFQDIESLKADNKKMQSEIYHINSSHDHHLYQIADHHRKKHLAHKTLHKWKGKLRSQKQIELLEEENKRLKRELLSCQEGAKNAFIRSANKLNSEALSMFQDSSKRQIESRLLPVPFDQDLNCSSSTLSTESSFSSIAGSESNPRAGLPERFASPSRENDRSRLLDSRCRSESRRSKPVRATTPQRESFSRVDEDQPYNSEHYKSTRKRKSSENEHEAGGVRQLPGFISDPYRRETRQIMKQFQIDKPKSQEHEVHRKDSRWELCQAKNHLHVCHCLPTRTNNSGKCPSCSPARNYNLSNMPIDDRASPLKPFNRPKSAKSSGQNLAMRKNVAFASSSQKDGRKSVFYKPTGTTVVIEKHLSS